MAVFVTKGAGIRNVLTQCIAHFSQAVFWGFQTAVNVSKWMWWKELCWKPVTDRLYANSLPSISLSRLQWPTALNRVKLTEMMDGWQIWRTRKSDAHTERTVQRKVQTCCHHMWEFPWLNYTSAMLPVLRPTYVEHIYQGRWSCFLLLAPLSPWAAVWVSTVNEDSSREIQILVGSLSLPGSVWAFFYLLARSGCVFSVCCS